MDEEAGGATVTADERAQVPARARKRPAIGWQVVILFGIYAILVLFCDPRGTLGTDTGAKVATLRTMQQHHTLVPSVGYWAKAQDPGLEAHPLLFTHEVGKHEVNVTTLPMLIGAYPLYDLGGYRLALLLPIAGAIGCALAARALAKRLGARDPDVVFWLVGLASPVAVYALDLWEHAPGLALMLFGVVKMLDAGEDDGRIRDGLFAGLLFGAAASMRTEAFVYGAVAGAVLLGARFVRTRRVFEVARTGVAAVLGIGAAFALNVALEIAIVGDSLRAGRTAGAASSSGAEASIRIKEAIITTFGLNYGSMAYDYLSAVCFVAFIAGCVLAVRRRWSTRATRDLLLLPAFPIVVRIVASPVFTPGFLVAFPLAALGIAFAWSDRRRVLVSAVALLALPLAWATEYVGGAIPQWGGRYILTTSIVLGVVGIVAASEQSAVLLRGVAALSLAITALGVVYVSQRSHSVAVAGRRVANLPSDVVISRDGFMLREFGAYYRDDRPWLTAWNDDLLRKALHIADERGAKTMTVLVPARNEAHRQLPGWRETSSTSFAFSLGRVYETNYERAP